MKSVDTTNNNNEAFESFKDTVNRIEKLRSIERVLNWDQQVIMPDAGTTARSEQQSVLSAVKHELLVSDEMSRHLEALEKHSLEDHQEAMVREIRRRYNREAAVSTDLIQEIGKASSKARQHWEDAKDQADFETFAPHLEKLVELKREHANQIHSEKDPYAVLFDEYAPYIDFETAQQIFARLRTELIPFIAELRAKDTNFATPFEGVFPTATQEELPREAMDILGFDWDRGRLDTASHPFCEGNQFDARVATRIEETDPLGTITGTIHEFGHALYEQGLPDEEFGTPLGSHRGVVVHESQARLWQNHVGLSYTFWDLFADTVNDHLGTNATPGEFYEAANRIHHENPIRVEADELTYHVHILVRFEIERALIRGNLEVAEVPNVWNDKMEKYLGVRPETDREGCLQDPHWALGHFGYFPTYSLGSVLATQFFDAAKTDLGELAIEIETGNFDPLREWLHENVHQHGQRYTTEDLITRTTGEELTAEPFLEYVREKYESLY